MIKRTILGLLLAIVHVFANPPSQITSAEIITRVAEHYAQYSHVKATGVCVRFYCDWSGCGTHSSLELDEYLPDLVVSSYQASDDNPWLEASTLIDQPSEQGGSSMTEALLGMPMGQGNTYQGKEAFLIHKVVDVIGNPWALFHFPFPQLKLDTQPFVPYYQSNLDVFGGRMGMGEAIRHQTYNPFSHFIGQGFANHWGYAFPRSMNVNTTNDYKAALIAALHAADIVTNHNALHTVISTQNRCGENCAVANVIEETKEDHVIWQEVYPKDRHVHIGEDDALQMDSLGHEDDNKGDGNYVFVLWRHYQGCQQGKGKLIYATHHIYSTQKR